MCVFGGGGSTYWDKYTSQSNMHHDIQTILDKIMNAFQAQIQEFPPRLIDNLKIKEKERKKLFCGCWVTNNFPSLKYISLYLYLRILPQRGVGGGIISNDL